ncbi:PP2C family protein-serine/threonine phosphatase [Azospirillum rugosum]|uniref:Serine/threonine protein phosphatase PrpC n=1 Tax=Azospirillum rugosum TaxID=416170 RepID=A0ABS4SKW8_9PROT|nr:protein phosphatase 2C domain-containing protein [Azospirillum rugosum]MBP2293205.1 serine/threonine protein phosphatase PrpC [Azospirillum rugosum]
MSDGETIDDHAPTRTFWFHTAAISHAGTVRSVNEDACLDRSNVGLWAVADGMGGHEAGDYASRTVVEALNRCIDPAMGAPAGREIRAALDGCNAALLDHAGRLGSAVVGSTVVVLTITGRRFSCAWAGDSRLYRARSGAFVQVTRDHSYVQQLIDSGVLDPSEAEGHAKSNVITRAVGATDALVLDTVEGDVNHGDLFLLCSDGLTKTLADADISGVLDAAGRSADGVAEAAARLLDAALARGARDNVTLVLVLCEAVAGPLRTPPPAEDPQKGDPHDGDPTLTS